MTREAAFLEGIIEAPDDDGLRLICADWLELPLRLSTSGHLSFADVFQRLSSRQIDFYLALRAYFAPACTHHWITELAHVIPPPKTTSRT